MQNLRDFCALSRRQFLCVGGVLGALPGALAERASRVVRPSARIEGSMVADFERCQPSSAISPLRKKGAWRLIPFQAEGVQGNMLSATQHTAPPTVRYPLNRSGWHAIYLGIYNPELAESDFLLRLKLSGDRHFVKIGSETGPDTHHLEEIFWKKADLTGQDLLIATQSAGLSRFAQLAFLRVVSLTASQVESYRDSLPRPETRLLVAQNDGHGSFYSYAPQTAADLEEQLEVFRDTDFRALYWATGSHGPGLVHFPSRVGSPFGQHLDDYGRRGDKLYAESLKNFLERGVDPLRVVIEYVHSLGMEIHITQRLTMAIWPPLDDLMVPFFVQHPEWTCRDRQNNPIIRMSLAYPQVRKWFLDQYSEMAGYGIEGIGIQFNRRPPMVLFEDPVVRDFKEQYRGLDPRDLRDDDPRLLKHWARYVTQFFRELRQSLDRFQRPDGGRLSITVNVLGDETKCRAGGLDPETWIREELVDYLIPYQSSTENTWSPTVDTAYFSSLTRGSRCQFICDIMPRRMPGRAYAVQALKAYQGGAHQLAFWDTNSRDLRRTEWDTIRQLGHRDRLSRLAVEAIEPRAVPLNTIFGYSIQRRYM